MLFITVLKKIGSKGKKRQKTKEGKTKDEIRNKKWEIRSWKWEVKKLRS